MAAKDVKFPGIDETGHRDPHTVTFSYTTAARPDRTGLPAGFMYFDTTLGKPLWLKADKSGWVDSAGADVA